MKIVRSKLEYLQALIYLVYTYLVACALEGRLVFADIVFSEKIVDWLSNDFHIFIIVVPLWVSDWLLRIAINNKTEDKDTRRINDNICKHVFKKYIKPLAVEDQLIKVSLFKAYKDKTEKPMLKLVGRHQTKMPYKKTKVMYGAGEGCVGICFETAQFVYKQIADFDEKLPHVYYKESYKEFKLPEKKSKKLNDKACEFLCLPIKYFQADRVWGVLSIDAMKGSSLNSIKV